MAVPFSTTSGLDFLVELLRYRISDLKYTYSNVIQEDAGTANGTANELFYIDYVPAISSFDTHLRVEGTGAKYYYTRYNTEADCSGKRGYIFSAESGYFMIPTGAILATSGSRVKVSYTYLEEQDAKFSDDELRLYVGDAITTVNNSWYNFGHTFSATGSTWYVSPTPDASSISSYLYALYAAFLVKKQLESEGFGDRIYVRDINITIDTSKGLGDLQKSAKDLMENFKSIVNELRLRGQTAAFARIDTYSTAPIDYGSYEYQTNYSKDDNFF